MGLSEWAMLEFPRTASKMRTPVIIDGRKLWSGEEVESTGFSYRCMGVGEQPMSFLLDRYRLISPTRKIDQH